MIKYIATDLDGTLFYPKDKSKFLVDENLFFIQSFIDKGGKLILCSGRSIDSATKVKEEINRKCDIIGFNGMIIKSENLEIKNKCIDNEIAKNIIDSLFNNYKVFCVLLMGENGASFKCKYKGNFWRKLVLLINENKKSYKEKLKVTEEEYYEDLNHGKIYKIMFLMGALSTSKRIARKANNILRKIYPDLEAAWCDSAIEITPFNMNKGNALKEYCSLNNINEDDVAVVGDSGNDISMFKTFKNSFCMKHSPTVIKKYARYTISKVNELSRYI